MKPTTKLSSKYADLRPTGNGKGICRADLPQNMSVNVQSKLYYTPHISLYVCTVGALAGREPNGC